jgi:threonylcarbamoyladenosine tRNA methylthiotransferase MtaB
MLSAPQVITFGCRLNTYESEVMRGHAQAAGLTNTIIFNTCAVTSEAERQARQAIRRAKRDNPQAEIIVTGCAAAIDPARFAAMPEVTRLIANDQKTRRGVWDGQATDPTESAAYAVTGFEGLARGFVQVQNGCDHRCTFCIIPYGRGPSRSVPLGEIVAQVRSLVEAGYNEIVLTGVDIASFGPDLPGSPTLGQMVKRLLALVPELPRLRLSSLDPAAVDADLWRLIAEEPRLMPHLHLSVQAGDDMILKRMKRRHSRADVLALVSRARALRPDIALGADLIAGFPTETATMAANTEALVAEAGLTYLHVFPYSPRPGTPAAKMPSVHGETVKERAASLRRVGQGQLDTFLASRIGRHERILVEAKGVGRTEQFAETSLPDTDIVGSVVERQITGIEGNRLGTA